MMGFFLFLDATKQQSNASSVSGLLNRFDARRFELSESDPRFRALRRKWEAHENKMAATAKAPASTENAASGQSCMKSECKQNHCAETGAGVEGSLPQTTCTVGATKITTKSTVSSAQVPESTAALRAAAPKDSATCTSGDA